MPAEQSCVQRLLATPAHRQCPHTPSPASPCHLPPPPTHTPHTRLLHNSTLAKIQPRSVSYPEQSQAIREALARVLEGEEEWTKAAQVLQGIDLDSGGWSHTDCI